MRVAFISEESVAFPLSALCRVLEASKTGYYAWTARPPSKHVQRDADLRAQIRTAYRARTGRDESPRVHAELGANRQRVSRKRVARLIREEFLVGRTRRRFRTTTDSNHPFPIAPNLLARDFATTAPNKVWVTDITAIWTARSRTAVLGAIRLSGWGALTRCFSPRSLSSDAARRRATTLASASQLNCGNPCRASLR